MYQFSKNLKIVSLCLMVVGALALGIGFLSAPNTVEEAKAMVADAHGHGGHGDHGGHETHKHMPMTMPTTIKKKLIMLRITRVTQTFITIRTIKITVTPRAMMLMMLMVVVTEIAMTSTFYISCKTDLGLPPM